MTTDSPVWYKEPAVRCCLCQWQSDIRVKRWPIERLILRADNPRTHSREPVAGIAASMRDGWTNPILVGADDDTIAGHARLLAAGKLGMKECPVIVLRHLSPAPRCALVIADNQLAIAGAGMKKCFASSWRYSMKRITTSTSSASTAWNSGGYSRRGTMRGPDR